MKTLKILNLFICIILLSTLTLSQGTSSIPGAFVDIGYGSRPVAMGSAFVGLANDVNTLVWNPAGLSQLNSKDVSFTFSKQLALLNYYYLTFGMPMSDNNSGAGFALIYNGDEALKELTLNFGYSYKLGPLYSGINVKYRYASFGKNSLSANSFPIFEEDEISQGIANQITGSANGFGLDIGLLYPIDEQFSVGLVIRDVYSPVFWNSNNNNPINKPKGSYSETVPLEAAVGISFKPFDEFIFVTDYLPAVQGDAISKIRFGGEIMFFKMVFVRAGYQQFINNRDDEKFSVGLGLNLTNLKAINLKIDYTFMSEELANTQRFSLSIGF